MIRFKLSAKHALCLAAVVFIAALALLCPAHAFAQSAAAVVTGSDALAAALADPACSSIELDPSGTYVLPEKISVSRTLTINGKGASVDFAENALLELNANSSVTISALQLRSKTGNSIALSGSLTLGEKVSFDGVGGILMNSGSRLTSGGSAVTGGKELERLVQINTGGGVVILDNIRLAQSSGDAAVVEILPSAGKITLSGTVDLLAADGPAMICTGSGQGPDIIAADSSVLAVAAPKAAHNQASDVPGAAIYVPTCSFTTGSGSRLGLTGSYCGVYASDITLGKDSVVTAQCDIPSPDSKPVCAAISTTGKLNCLSGSKITIGSSGGSGSGLYGSQITLESNASVIFRSSSDSTAALASTGAISMASGSSLVTNGGGYGIHCASLSPADNTTLDINDAALDGIYSTSDIKLGKNVTADISAKRCAVYSKGSLSLAAGDRVTFSSAGDGAALWLEGSASVLTVDGASLTVTCSSSQKASVKAAVSCGGGVSLLNAAQVFISNSGDIGLINAGGSISISGGSTLRCTAGLGILVSRGSILLSGKSTLCAEGLVDSAIRIESGSFSATDGSVCDVEGKRFGVEVTSGDFFIDGAAAFDIRSKEDRAVYVHNGRMTFYSIDRISAWLRAEDKNNAKLWWVKEPEIKYSWEAPGTDKSNWLCADHTALSPHLSQEFVNGNGQPADFAWYDSPWSPADYSRLGRHMSQPVARPNSFIIPAGKSFSWLLFGQSYDEALKFRLKSSSGDGTFELLEDGSFTYSANDYTRGSQTFEFTVENSDGVVSKPAVISILVTASKPPIASSATFPVPSDDPFVGQLTVIDYDGSIASIKIEQQPLHGNLVINSDGKFSYTPHEEYSGVDSFSYYATDNMGDKSNIAQVTLPVMVSDRMVACNDSMVSESSSDSTIRLAALRGTETVLPSPEFTIISYPTYGVLGFDPLEPDLATYTPYKDFSGTDSFTFAAVNEDGSLSEPAFVNISTIPSQRPAATPGIFYCSKNSGCDGRLSGYDIDGQITAFAITVQPENGTVELDSVTGEFVYTASRGFTASDCFYFSVTDSDGLKSEEVKVEVVVSSLIDNLRQTGRLGAAVVLLCIAVAAIAAFAALIIVSVSRHRRYELMEMEKSRLFDFGGSVQDDYYDDDYYDDGYNGYGN